MKNITAVSNKVLLIDLSKDEIRTLEVPEKIRRDYIGGKGLALKLLHDNIKPGIEALSDDNVLVFATGPTAGTAAPAGNRFVIASKSPLTGIFACSYVGGRFGLSLKKAGFDGLIVTGKSQKPINIHIIDDKVTFEDAADDWGLDTYDFQEKHVDAGEWVVIGPAGENLVKYSVIASKKRVAGRCGLGAVMGSKNIKGISATGSLKVKPTDPGGFKKSLRIAQKKVLSHDNSGRRLKELGTAQNVRIYGSSNIMPVRNFSKPSFDKLEDISAEKIRDNHTIKSAGCTGCPIKCGKVGNYNGKKLITPEYETIAIMGANLLISDISKIALWNDKLNRLCPAAVGRDIWLSSHWIDFNGMCASRKMCCPAVSCGIAESLSMTSTWIIACHFKPLDMTCKIFSAIFFRQTFYSLCHVIAQTTPVRNVIYTSLDYFRVAECNVAFHHAFFSQLCNKSY